MPAPGEECHNRPGFMKNNYLVRSSSRFRICGAQRLFTLAAWWCLQRSALSQPALVTFGALATTGETRMGTIDGYHSVKQRGDGLNVK